MMTSERLYPVRRPLAAGAAGAAVALLGGLIGLGGAEFRLPLLITVFALYAHRAVRINLLISLATLAVAAIARVGLLHSTHVGELRVEVAGMIVGGVVAAWVGAGYLNMIPKTKIIGVISILLLGTAALLATETLVSGTTWALLSSDSGWIVPAAVLAGLLVGAISSLLGVAGGEFIIPILIFVFGADIRTAGTASLLISLPVVFTGVVRHMLTGHFRSRSTLTHLVLPMCLGSIAGAVVGSYLAVWAPTEGLRIALAAILAVSAVKLLKKLGGN